MMLPKPKPPLMQHRQHEQGHNLRQQLQLMQQQQSKKLMPRILVALL
jgi:hypothetical protein